VVLSAGDVFCPFLGAEICLNSFAVPVDLLKEILSFKPRLALFTTYTLDLAFFESEIFAPLQDANENVQVTLLVDRATYWESALAGRFVRKAESEYRLLPVRAPGGVFHPKICLLVGEDWARLYIGSANLTRTGFQENLELVDCVEWNREDQQNAACFAGASGFLRRLIDAQLVPSNGHAPINAARNALEKIGVKDSPAKVSFGSSLSSSLDHELEAILPADCTDIRICSPYHDARNETLTAFAQRYPAARIELLVPKESSHVNPKMSATILKRVGFVGFKSPQMGLRFLHAKCYLARNRKESILVVGSANFTTPGFMSEYRQGNIETWIIRRGVRDTFDGLFEGPNSLVELKQCPSYRPMTHSPQPSFGAFIVDHASYDDATLRVLIRQEELKGVCDVVVRIEGFLGRIFIRDRITLKKGQQTLSFSIGPSDGKKLTSSCYLYLEFPPSQVRRSNSVWIELTGQLALDARERRLRDALAELENQVLERGRPVERRGIDRILKTLADWLREASSETEVEGQTLQGRASSTTGAGPEMPSANIPLSWDDGSSSGSEVARGTGGRIHLLAEMVSVLKRFAEQDSQQVRKRIKAETAGSSDDEDPEDSGRERWVPDQDFVGDYRSHFEEMLELLREVKNEPALTGFGLRTLECLAQLSFLINLVMIGCDDSVGDHRQQLAFREHEETWRKIVRFLLASVNGEGQEGVGWLNGRGVSDAAHRKSPLMLGTMA